MGIQIGPWDPLKLIFNIMNSFMERNLISYEEAKKILTDSLPEDMSAEEKRKIVDKMVIRKNG